MANAITLTSFTNPDRAQTGTADGLTAVAKVYNVENIISVSTRATAYRTTGITDVVIEYPVNQSVIQVPLICTETRAAILALMNAPLA